jgi:hypothetical protein
MGFIANGGTIVYLDRITEQKLEIVVVTSRPDLGCYRFGLVINLYFIVFKCRSKLCSIGLGLSGWDAITSMAGTV